MLDERFSVYICGRIAEMTKEESLLLGKMQGTVDAILDRVNKQNGYLKEVAKTLTEHTAKIEEWCARVRALEVNRECEITTNRAKHTDKTVIKAALIGVGGTAGGVALGVLLSRICG